MSIDGMFASHYSRVISEKVHNAYVKLHAEGRCTYLTPIGYLDHGSDNKPLDPERAPIVKRIFELYCDGEWSFSQLGKWAQEQGLTKKPIRRKRTQEEMLGNLDPSSLPKVARPVDHKTIEYILKNPFYIGKIKTQSGYQDGRFHQPLIDRALFNKVQEILKRKNAIGVLCRQTLLHVSRIDPVHLREAVHTLMNRRESSTTAAYARRDATTRIRISRRKPISPPPSRRLWTRYRLPTRRLTEIEAAAKSGLEKVSAQRDSELEDLHAKQRRIAADLGYLAEHRITILRTGAMTPEALRAEEERLKADMEHVNADITARGASAREMLDFTIAFSELVKNASLYFEHALDSEKREITTQIFSELVFKDRTLVKYSAKDGFWGPFEAK